MDQRRALAYAVLEQGVSISEAARRFCISRPTARLWVRRAREHGIGSMQERSRRPLRSARITDEEDALALLALKARYPFWGAKKLLAIGWPDAEAPMSLRTANRILERAGLVCESHKVQEASQRFERAFPNELWQMDFKGLKAPRLPYEALSVVDDATRFCIALRAVPDQSFASVWSVLWDVFAEYGLPECILCDNGPAFRAFATPLPSRLEMRLLRLGVRTSHGRPRHPQTQGKVERFHGTLHRELGVSLRQPDAKTAQSVYEGFRVRYNWERPHEALGMQPPGSAYSLSARPRPSKLPEQELPEGALSRKVDDYGNFGYRSQRYKIGRGLAGERVELRDGPDGETAVLYFGVVLARLEDIRV
ncbi:MAG: DDE-type integrase/transposase/recombinase [Fimbriimonadaceae bacterium]|nr:DDE-type integrase/transposase/recombinase [Fimbriimonadaceae bacterium]